jgi:iron complex outermembrane receptor protein
VRRPDPSPDALQPPPPARVAPAQSWGLLLPMTTNLARNAGRRRCVSSSCVALAFAALLALPAPARAAAGEDFTSLSLEELMNVEVTTASKRPETLRHTAAAAFVITQEDIRRSGVTSIPELLRMVPGIEVARVNSGTYAISARGFNGVYANKLLVLMDGRSVYTPLFSGVQWDLQDTLLEDVERIEVIRGPGGTLWGANAFNGVINIITKSAAETLGALVTGRVGNRESGAGARVGAKIGDATSVRVFGKYDHYEANRSAGGGDANDRFDFGRAGFRLDSDLAPGTRALLEGSVGQGTKGEIFQRLAPVPPFRATLQPSNTDVNAAHVLGRLTMATATSGEWQLQGYVDWTDRDMTIIAERRITADVELQHRSKPFEAHELVWGGGYRVTRDITEGTFDISLVPSNMTEQLGNLFLQDEITLLPGTLRLTLGSKLEYNDYTGTDLQPNARLLWTPDPHHAVWGAISRAVRTPSRAERDLNFAYTALTPPAVPIPTLVTVFGNRSLSAEKVTAFEAGYRWQPVQSFNVDLATFYNIYDDLITVERGAPRLAGGALLLPAVFDNRAHGTGYGAEVGAGWQPLSWVGLRAAYTFLDLNLKLRPGSVDTTTFAYEHSSPRHQIYARGSVNLTDTVSVDLVGRYVDRLALSTANSALLTIGDVGSYWAFDVRLAWQPVEHIVLELVGQNLNQGRHVEFRDFGPTRAATAEIERSVFARATFRY